MTHLDSFSFGGGQQSTACLVLAAQGRIDCNLFIFANVGDDSEDTPVLDYLRGVSMPFALEHGLELIERHRVLRDGTQETLLGRMTKEKPRIAIPFRTKKDGKPVSRQCTVDFKIQVIDKELKRRGFTSDRPAIVGMGISVEEIERAAPGLDPRSPLQIRSYPLLFESPHDPYSPGLQLTRDQCVQIVLDAGLPEPPSSSCTFCPYHDMEVWRRQKRQQPETFARSCALEASLTEKRGSPVFLTRYGKPLADVVDDQLALAGMDGCESGRCFT